MKKFLTILALISKLIADDSSDLDEIKEEDIPKLAHYADKEGNPLYPVPVLMDARADLLWKREGRTRSVR